MDIPFWVFGLEPQNVEQGMLNYEGLDSDGFTLLFGIVLFDS
jgi:hypothetical protein